MRKVILLFAIPLLFLGCDNEGPTKATPEDLTYFPLHVGDSWVYVPGWVNDPISSRESTIESTQVIEGKTYFKMTTVTIFTDGRGPMTAESFYRVDAQGFVYVRNSDSKRESNIFRLAVSDGTKWAIESGPLADREVSVSEEGWLKYSGGVCKSYFFDRPTTIDDEHSYLLAPGIGIVSESSPAWISFYLVEAVVNGQEYTFEFDQAGD